MSRMYLRMQIADLNRFFFLNICENTNLWLKNYPLEIEFQIFAFKILSGMT